MEQLIYNTNTTSAFCPKTFLFDFLDLNQSITHAQEIFRTSVIAVGMLLNCTVFLVIVFARQLSCYPRHVFWAGISLCECLYLVECSLEMSVILNRDQLTCQIFVLLSSADYSILLLCIFLAALERYLSITCYEWYHTTVTVPGVVLLLSSASLLTFAVATFPFWTGQQSIHNFSVNLNHMYWIYVWSLFLGLVGVMLHVKIFIKTRHLRNYKKRPITIRFVNRKSRPRNASPFRNGPSLNVNTSTENQNKIFSPEDHFSSSEINRIVSECCDPVGSRSKVNRVEVRAAHCSSLSLLPFWLSTISVSCSFLLFYWCSRIQSDCISILIAFRSFREFFMMNSIYNPAIYMYTSSEFQHAFLHLTRKITVLLLTDKRKIREDENYN